MSSRTALGLSAPDLSGLDGSGLKVAVVAAQWHGTVMTGLLDGALRGLVDSGVRDPAVIRVQDPSSCRWPAPPWPITLTLSSLSEWLSGEEPRTSTMSVTLPPAALQTSRCVPRPLSVSAFLPVTMKPKPSTVLGSRIPRRQGL
ncbi:6,7-dimethyl-8-ribityllumazine synthase [Cutibacterium acnes JCM 18920]|nr:6,7-dimethyl-8-ribityllumazine synthase [Cutibacterium acnes JCM 18920]